MKGKLTGNVPCGFPFNYKYLYKMYENANRNHWTNWCR